MPLTSRFLVGTCALVALLFADAPTARAMSCIQAMYESLELELISVQRRGEVADLPAEVGELIEAHNSADHGRAIMIRDGEWKRWWFVDVRPSTPTAAVADYLAAQAGRTMQTGCGFPIDYVPMVPGTYTYRDGFEGEDSHPEVTGFTLELRPGRDELWLRFALGADAYLVRYAVTCAHFGDEPCAPSEPTSPAPGGRDGATGAGVVPPAGGPGAGKPGCRGCGTSGDAGTALGPATLAALILLGLGRRRRARPARP